MSAARSRGSAQSRRSRWRDRAYRRGGAIVVGPARGGAAAKRILTRALRQEYSRPAQKMWSLPHGACVAGSRPPVLTPAREGVSWTHDTSPWDLASGAEPIPMDRVSSLSLMTLPVLSSRLWAPDRISRSASSPMRRVMHVV